MVLTATKKVRKVQEVIVNLFPCPVFSSQIPPPPIAWTRSGTLGVAVASGTNFWAIERNFLGGWLPKSPIPLTGKKPNPSQKKVIKINNRKEIVCNMINHIDYIGKKP
jgi:hypothetical protein